MITIILILSLFIVMIPEDQKHIFTAATQELNVSCSKLIIPGLCCLAGGGCKSSRPRVGELDDGFCPMPHVESDVVRI